MGDTHGISDTQVLEKQEQPPPQHFVDAVKYALSEIEEQKRRSWVAHCEEARKAQIRRRSQIIRQKNVIWRASSCGCNLPQGVILGLPAIFACYFDPVNYLFTDSEYYSIPVSSTLKCVFFVLMCVILIYCFRSSAFIIEGVRLDGRWMYWLVSFPDPAFIESGSGTFRAISCISRSRDHKVVMATSLKAIDCRELYRAS